MKTPRILQSVLASPFGNIANVMKAFMAILTVFSACVSVGSAAPPSARELLERGIRQETILADIDAAIRSYQDALGHEKLGPLTKLEATFRLAECQETLGNSLVAWVGYHEASTFTGLTNALPEEALAAKVSLEIDLAEDNEDYDSTNIHHLGDLFLGLEGALTHSESSRALDLIESFQSPLSLLLEEAETFPDHRLLTQIQTDLTSIGDFIDSNNPTSGLTLLKESPYHQAFVSREALSAEDEVFGYALERLDNVVRALNEGSVIRAETQLQSVKAYLAPLSPWPRPADLHGTRHGYFRKLEALLAKLESAIVKDQLAEARQSIDDFTSEQAKDGGMVHWHLEDALVLDFANPDVLPYFAAANLHVEAVADSLSKDAPAEAKAHLTSAIQVTQQLLTNQTNTSDESGAARFLEILKEMAEMLDSSRIDALLKMIEVDQQEPES